MQIQLPDELYRQLKDFADSREWSFAETLRRAGEMLVGTAPKRMAKTSQGWELPGPFDMGKQRVPDSHLTEFANIGHLLEQLKRD